MIYVCKWQFKIFQAADVDGLRAEVQNLVLIPRHPSIVLLVGFSISKPYRGTYRSPMLVMELLDSDLHSLGCTDESPKMPAKKKNRLTERLSRLRKKCGGQLNKISTDPIRIAVDFIHQIANGMLFLQKSKVFHGELKGKNVLVKRLTGDSMQLKITDFGLSEKLIIRRHYKIDSDDDFDCSAFSDHSSLGVRHRSGDGNANGNVQVLGNVGTVRWMAPKVYGVADGDMKPYSMKADVYSFAMTCVEILTRQHPFPDVSSLKKVRERVKRGGRPDLSMVEGVPGPSSSL